MSASSPANRNLDLILDVPVKLTVELVARGEVVVVENQFGIKIIELVGSTPTA